MLPLNLYLLRHGESEGNVALKKLRAGDVGEIPPEFWKRLTHEWRLTSRGVEQARAAGKWLRAALDGPLDRCLVSSYTRAEETAGHALPDERWFVEPYLRERSWGTLDTLDPIERMRQEPDIKKAQDRDPFHWSPPGGESMALILSHTRLVLDTLWNRGYRNVALCLHGEKMWAFIIRFLKMRVAEYERLHRSENPHEHIHNCQIVQFTRQDPGDPSVPPKESYGWWRSVCPWDMARCNPAWRKIQRSQPLGRELLEEVERFPRFVDSVPQAP